MKYEFSYKDEKTYRKLERALKKYNMLAYKKLNFEYYPTLRNGEFLGELISSDKKNSTKTYELKLPSDNYFEQVHGEVKLRYVVYEIEHVVMLDTIMPTEILLKGHADELTTYKGVLVNKNNYTKDCFKIDLLSMLRGDDDK